MESITERVAGFVFTAQLPVRMSREGPVFHSRDLRRFELSVARRLAELGVATGEAFCYLRKSLGFTLTQVAALLDVVPETIRKWESGDVEVPRAAFALLGTMVDDELRGNDRARRYLEALAHPASPAEGEILVTLEDAPAPEADTSPSPASSEAGALAP